LREEEVEWGGGLGQGEEEGIIIVAQLYRVKTRVGTNVLTFVPGGLEEAPTCPCEWVFVSGGFEEAPMHPCEGAFVPDGGFTRYKYYYLYRKQKYPDKCKIRPETKCLIL
jgi:hypothetical protein